MENEPTVHGLSKDTGFKEPLVLLSLTPERFARDLEYRVPTTLAGKRIESEPGGPHMDGEQYYRYVMDGLQEAYKKLLNAGVPADDAALVLPFAALY